MPSFDNRYWLKKYMIVAFIYDIFCYQQHLYGIKLEQGTQCYTVYKKKSYCNFNRKLLHNVNIEEIK